MEKELLLAKMAEQQRLKESIRVMQAAEKNLRIEILEECFGTNSIGSVKKIVGGMVVKGTFTLEHKIDNKAFAKALADDNIPAEAMDGIRTKYELDKKGYDGMDEEYQLILDDFITTKPALPTLEIKELDDEE